MYTTMAKLQRTKLLSETKSGEKLPGLPLKPFPFTQDKNKTLLTKSRLLYSVIWLLSERKTL